MCLFSVGTCVESTPPRPSASMHSSFSRFLMSGLAALISILRLDVGVQGSTEPTSLPFLGVVRGPMVYRLRTDQIISLEYLEEPGALQIHHPSQTEEQQINANISDTIPSSPTRVCCDLSQLTIYIKTLDLDYSLWFRFQLNYSVFSTLRSKQILKHT